MAKSVINQMVRAVNDGFTPRSVFEATLTYHPGSAVKVNKDTKGQLFPDGGEVDVPKGSIVSVVGVGAGPSGKDHLVRLPDGRQATVPFYDLGESLLRRSKGRFHEGDDDKPKDKDEDDPSRSDDEPGMGTNPAEGDDEPDEGDDDPSEDGDDDDARYVRVELSKPLNPDAEQWLKSGYHEVGDVELPEMPEDDQPDGVTFLMKAKDQEALGKAIGELKKVAAENIQKIEPASKEDWKKT